ncbi:connectin-like [Bradysia coprophila]|uniref:connectin-like n=1 Tax=Bradysia coprophila TaxID=38358 RepID=UPI00187DAFD1|nr:connectin-like [Bradysia coprophila]
MMAVNTCNKLNKLMISGTFLLLHQVYRVTTMECGTVNIVRPRVLGGTDALKGEWPFVATIQNQSNYICGGTIISNRHILTAAHCVQKKNSLRILSPHEVIVRVGSYNISNESEMGVVQRNVSDIFIHPDWDVFAYAFDADIAILVLSETITFTYGIQPVCMPADGIMEQVEGIVVGWGLQENRMRAEIPRQTSVRAINESHCLREDNGIAIFTSARTFCGGDGDGTPSSGDSGGGFFFISGSSWAQYGILSAIRANATGHVIPNAYHIYTNLTQFKNWMIETVNQTGGEVGEAVLSIIINGYCDYTDSADPDKAFYKCWLYDIDIQRNNVEVSRFVGSHLLGKTNMDVESIHFQNGTMYYLPNGFGLFFGNIKYMIVGDGKPDGVILGTKAIRRSDLQNLDKLLKISFLRNDIETLNGDSLWDLPNLQFFRLIYNRLRTLSDETFIKNKELKEVYLNSNQLSSLPASLFENNLLLEIVDLRKNFLRTIDERLFQTNSRLRGISFVSNLLEMLPANLLKNIFSLTLVDFKNNLLTTIDETLFETNGNLTAASFASNRIESLPRNLFRNNSLLDIVYFRNNSLTALNDNLFEKNEKLKSVSFASNRLALLQRNLFKNNLLLRWIDFSNNTLKDIYMDFDEFQQLRLIDLTLNNCVNAKFVRQTNRNPTNDSKIFGNVAEFKRHVSASCIG